jgi:hypothetical protein
MMIDEDLEGNGYGLIAILSWRDWENRINCSVRISRVPTRDSNWASPEYELQRYRYANPLFVILNISIFYSSFWISWGCRTAIFITPWRQQYDFNANLCGGSKKTLWIASCYVFNNFVNLDRQHNIKKDIFKVETRWMLWCLLFVLL